MSTQQRGIIRTWKDEKGFGFITPDTGAGDVFFHISEVVERQKRPEETMVVYFNLTRDEQHRLRAVNIHLENESLTPILLSLLVGIVFYILVGSVIVFRLLPPWVLVAYLVLSGVTYFMYGDDKTRAVMGQRRIPENQLHFFEFLGGWPGALVAQSYFRHKNRKVSYQVVYWIIVLLNILILTVVVIMGSPALLSALRSIV